jgi:hypothetical protein
MQERLRLDQLKQIGDRLGKQRFEVTFVASAMIGKEFSVLLQWPRY